MRIRYYLGHLRRSILYAIRNYKLRKNNSIGNGCKIDKSAILKGNVRLGNNVSLGKNVILEKNVKIGSNSVLHNILIGENSHVEGNVITTGHGTGKISIGKECYIGVSNVLDFSDNITIGNFVHIAGPSTGLWTHTSAKMCLNGDALENKTPQNRPTAPIVIESNVYVGGNSTIYPGITINHHVIVAPNSAVNKDIESNTMVGGVPAKKIKTMDNGLNFNTSE